EAALISEIEQIREPLLRAQPERLQSRRASGALSAFRSAPDAELQIPEMAVHEEGVRMIVVVLEGSLNGRVKRIQSAAGIGVDRTVDVRVRTAGYLQAERGHGRNERYLPGGRNAPLPGRRSTLELPAR